MQYKIMTHNWIDVSDKNGKRIASVYLFHSGNVIACAPRYGKQKHTMTAIAEYLMLSSPTIRTAPHFNRSKNDYSAQKMCGRTKEYKLSD